MDWKRILENDRLPVIMAQDEGFTRRDFIMSKMQAACVRVHTIGNLFVRDGNSQKWEVWIQGQNSCSALGAVCS